MTIVNI